MKVMLSWPRHPAHRAACFHGDRGSPEGKRHSQPGGFRGFVRVRLLEARGRHQEGGEAWRRFREVSRLRWASLLSLGHHDHTKATALERIVSGLGFSTRHLGAQLGYRDRLAPRQDRAVSADPSRSGHPTDSWSPSSDTLLCPTPRRGLSAPE